MKSFKNIFKLNKRAIRKAMKASKLQKDEENTDNNDDDQDTSTDSDSDGSNSDNEIMGHSGHDYFEPGSDEGDESVDSGSNSDDSIEGDSEGSDEITTGNAEDSYEVSNGGDDSISYESGEDDIEVGNPEESEPSNEQQDSDGDPITHWNGDPTGNLLDDFMNDLSNGFWTKKSKRMKIARGVFTDGPNKQRVPGVEYASIGQLESDTQIDDVMEQISGLSTRKLTRLLIQANPDLF